LRTETTRYETLRRTGVTHAWIVLLFAGEVERDRFLKEHGAWPTGASEMALTDPQVAEPLEEFRLGDRCPNGEHRARPQLVGVTVDLG
jgi:hypothetical protein